MSIRKSTKPKIIVICGPTGSGKTGLAVSLCKKFNGEIVNADSRQVYKYMDIGTAKGLDKKNKKLKIKNKKFGAPSAHTIDGVPVHLVDITEPCERYSVGQFKKDAEEAIVDILSRGKMPFVVGGTGLYIDALVENFKLPISNVKPASPNRGESISNFKFQILNLKSKNLKDLVKYLEKLDPEALKIVDLKNRRRVERAIQVCLETGIPFSKQRTRGERKYEVLKLAPMVSLDREKLYEKINKRVEEMINEGLEGEVRMLAEKYGWESEAMTGIGYREWKILFVKSQIPNPKSQTNPKSEITKEDIINKIKQDTRNYAKRQITWFKRDKDIQYIDLKKAEKLIKEFLKKS